MIVYGLALPSTAVVCLFFKLNTCNDHFDYLSLAVGHYALFSPSFLSSVSFRVRLAFVALIAVLPVWC